MLFRSVQEISELIPDGSVSVEVVDENILSQAIEMNSWIPNAHIKFPTTTAGLEAAVEATKLKMNVNMTLCFDQSQGVGVHAATRSVNNNHGLYTFPTSVYISPFVGMSKHPIKFMLVLFPDPLFPINATNSPFLASKFSPLNALTSTSSIL